MPYVDAYAWQIGPFWQDTLDVMELPICLYIQNTCKTDRNQTTTKQIKVQTVCVSYGTQKYNMTYIFWVVDIILSEIFCILHAVVTDK